MGDNKTLNMANVMIDVDCDDIEDKNNMLKKARQDLYNSRHRLFEGDTNVDPAWIEEAESMLDDFEKKDREPEQKPVNEIDIKDYRRLAAVLKLPIKITVSKYGRHIQDCVDPSDPAFYNFIETRINSDGKEETMARHADKDGNVYHKFEASIPTKYEMFVELGPKIDDIARHNKAEADMNRGFEMQTPEYDGNPEFGA